MKTVLHESWDSGRCASAFHSVGLGPAYDAYAKPKTTKTRCGKRVVLSAISDGSATCPDCLASMERERLAHARINEYHKVLLEQGIDAANALASAWELSRG